MNLMIIGIGISFLALFVIVAVILFANKERRSGNHSTGDSGSPAYYSDSHHHRHDSGHWGGHDSGGSDSGGGDGGGGSD